MPKFRNRRTGEIVKAIYFDGTDDSYERVKKFFNKHAIIGDKIPPTHQWWPDCFSIQLVRMAYAVTICPDNFIYITPEKRITTDRPRDFFERYRKFKPTLS